MAAMTTFLDDYGRGRTGGRYVAAALPALPFAEGSFALALCSHLLFLYSVQLDEAFHHQAVHELCRVARDVRIFPVLTLDGRRSPFVDPIVAAAERAGHQASIEEVPYEFQRGGRHMLRIRTGLPRR
jgi:hypothetical protein